MSKIDLLIIGDAYHQYNINFCKWLKKEVPEIQVSILSTFPERNGVDISHVYHDINFISTNNSIFEKLPGCGSLVRIVKTLSVLRRKQLGKDAILIHYVKPWISLISFFLKSNTNKLVSALWGSDFYKCNKKQKLNCLFKHSDHIIIGSPVMRDDFVKEFPKTLPKISICYFGNQPIEVLREFKNTGVKKSDSRGKFGINDHKINITVGHNGGQIHQHLDAIKAISKIDANFYPKIRVILPMTYGAEHAYLEEVRRLCCDMPFESLILTDFISEEMVAHLRNLTDVMINVMINDAFSGSMREVLYCGGYVIAGSWLPYGFLREQGVFFDSVDSIDNLTFKLEDVLKCGMESTHDRCKENAKVIYSFSSWSKTIEGWAQIIRRTER
ncbi:glycosyltransferase [Echinicola sediminis]